MKKWEINIVIIERKLKPVIDKVFQLDEIVVTV
jgi:hypothetical protein